MGNRYIDRALLVPTLETHDAAFLRLRCGMDKLIQAITELAANSPPDKTEQLAGAIRRPSGADDPSSLSSWAANPRAKTALTELVAAWRGA
jgi:hypothetical protein